MDGLQTYNKYLPITFYQRMTFELLAFQQLSDIQKEKFYSFCQEASKESLPAAENMWSNSNQSLKFILENTNRFSHNGEFNILFYQEKVVLCGGVYISDFSKKIAIAGTRTWVNKDFRNQSLIRDYLLPAHKNWAILRQCKQIALTFNDYNKSLKRIFFRNRIGEKNKRLNFRTSEHLFFSNINEIPFPVNIQETPQWVLYEKLDPDWEFDWSTIKTDVYST